MRGIELLTGEADFDLVLKIKRVGQECLRLMKVANACGNEEKNNTDLCKKKK